MNAGAPNEHPERVLVRRAIDQQLTGLAVTTNPLAIALGMTIIEARDGQVKIGFTVDEQSRLQWDAVGALPEDQSVLDERYDAGAAFTFGLDLLTDGLSVRGGVHPVS